MAISVVVLVCNTPSQPRTILSTIITISQRVMVITKFQDSEEILVVGHQRNISAKLF